MSKAENLIGIRRATEDDAEAIAALLQTNEAARGGALTGHFDRTSVEAFLCDMPVVIATRLERLAGVLVSSSISASGHIPVIAQMLKTYRGSPDAYLYGPICIGRQERGRGLAERLFSFLKAELPGREGILFIRQDNAASIRAHRDKLKMDVRGVFLADGVEYAVLSYKA